MSKAAEYSFNIPSELFQQLTKEQQVLWRKEIESAFNNGYHQAEKDNELTWEDIRGIYCITLNLREHLGASVFGEPLYQKVLKLFRERKEK